MGTKAAVTYSGPRTFRAKSLDAMGELLERAFGRVDGAIRRLSDGGPRRWVFADALRGNGTVYPNVAIQCDTVSAPAIVLTLPVIDPQDYGLECGIVRLYASGIITLFPAGGATLDGSTSSQVLPTLAGFYTILITPTGYML